MKDRILELLEQTNASELEKYEIEKYLDKLEDDQMMLGALEINGVDNWTWWDEAVADYNRIKEEKYGRK